MASTDGDTQPLAKAAGDGTPAVSYRCVCGEVIAMDPSLGGTCQACGRHYHARALRGADTLSVSDSIAPLMLDNEPPENRVGQRFGHYQIVRRLGAGGMGEVYQALDESLQRYVALKVIRGQAAPISKQSDTRRLLQEAVAQARLNHPHVVHIYFVGQESGAPFLAMELVGGGTLAQRLETGPLAFTQVIDLALQIINALQHAGNFDIVHGDIKPSNLLMSEDMTVKLSDFGLARRLSTGREGADSVNGSPNYISPEGARGEATDVRSDMYSLGVLMFEMTFGRLPYSFDSGSGIIERLEAHQRAAVEFPRIWPKEIPDGFRRVLEKLLRKGPDDRYQFYGQLRDDLLKLRPVALPPPERKQRAVAWLIDLGLIAAAQAVLVNAPSNWTFEPLPLSVRYGLATLPIVAAWIIQTLWTTPGKHLFKIQVVDTDGLRASWLTRLTRAMWQTIPAWVAVAGVAFGWNWQNPWLAGLAALIGLPVALDALVALFNVRGTSLHDRAFKTQVVVNVLAYDPKTKEDERQDEDEEYWVRQYWSPLKREVRKLRKKKHQPLE